MRDVQLEQELLLAEGYCTSLRQFYDIVQTTVLQQVVVTEAEEQLMDVRERISRQSEKFYDTVGIDHDDKNISKMMTLARDLVSVIRLTDFQIKDLRDAWHQEYMMMNYYLGKLQYREELLEKLSVAAIKLRKVFNPIVVIILVVIAAYVMLLLLF